MITRATFLNFKALRDVEVTFDSRLTVLVGPNGSGKTSILEGMHLLSQFAIGRQQEELFSGGYQLDFLASRWTGANPESRLDVLLEIEFTEGGSDWQFQVVGKHASVEGAEAGPRTQDGWQSAAGSKITQSTQCGRTRCHPVSSGPMPGRTGSSSSPRKPPFHERVHCPSLRGTQTQFISATRA